ERKHKRIWQNYETELAAWKALPRREREENDRPREPHSYIVNDTTPEKLQHILANSTRGTMLLRDEIAGMFGFGRYSRDGGTAERSFYLEAYEGGSFTVHRATRETIYIVAQARAERERRRAIADSIGQPRPTNSEP